MMVAGRAGNWRRRRRGFVVLDPGVRRVPQAKAVAFGAEGGVAAGVDEALEFGEAAFELGDFGLGEGEVVFGLGELGAGLVVGGFEFLAARPWTPQPVVPARKRARMARTKGRRKGRMKGAIMGGLR